MSMDINTKASKSLVSAPNKRIHVDEVKPRKRRRYRRSGVRPRMEGPKCLPTHLTQRLLSTARAFVKLQGTGANVALSKVPFNPVIETSGIQNPTIRLHSDINTVPGNATPAINTTVLARASAFLGFSDLASLFDEYRPVRGGFVFRNTDAGAIPTTNPSIVQVQIVGCVDYENSTALTTYNEGLKYDSHKWVHCFGGPSENHFAMELDWLPDLQWLPVSTTTTDFAVWKSYAEATTFPGSITNGHIYGFVCMWMDFQFRQTA